MATDTLDLVLDQVGRNESDLWTGWCGSMSIREGLADGQPPDELADMLFAQASADDIADAWDHYAQRAGCDARAYVPTEADYAALRAELARALAAEIHRELARG